MSEERPRRRTTEHDLLHRVGGRYDVDDGITGIVEDFERGGDTDSLNLALIGLQESLRVLDPLGRQAVAQALKGFIKEGMYDSRLLDNYPEADQDRVGEILEGVIDSLQQEG